MDERNSSTLKKPKQSPPSLVSAEVLPDSAQHSHLLAAIDIASLSRCYMKDLYRIFDALAFMTVGNQQVHGLADVGLSLAERYEQEMLNQEHEFSSTLDALQGGAR